MPQYNRARLVLLRRVRAGEGGRRGTAELARVWAGRVLQEAAAAAVTPAELCRAGLRLRLHRQLCGQLQGSQQANQPERLNLVLQWLALTSEAREDVGRGARQQADP